MKGEEGVQSEIPEPVGTTDLTVVVFEILTVAVAMLAITRTKVLAGLLNPRWLMVAPSRWR